MRSMFTILLSFLTAICFLLAIASVSFPQEITPVKEIAKILLEQGVGKDVGGQPVFMCVKVFPDGGKLYIAADPLLPILNLAWAISVHDTLIVVTCFILEENEIIGTATIYHQTITEKELLSKERIINSAKDFLKLWNKPLVKKEEKI